MAEMAAEADLPKKNWLRFWCRLGLYFAIFVAVILTTLSAVGGKSEALKAGVEQFFTHASGYPSRVEKLNGLHFFPDFRLDIEGVEIGREGEIPMARLESLKAAMGFWDMFFKNGRIKAFDLRGLKAAPGFIGPEPILLEQVSILHGPGTAPAVSGQGMIGAERVNLRMDLQFFGPPFVYFFGQQRPFMLEWGAVKLAGTLSDDNHLLHLDGRMDGVDGGPVDLALDMASADDALTISGLAKAADPVRAQKAMEGLAAKFGALSGSAEGHIWGVPVIWNGQWEAAP